ncbi:MAG: hypothetical protein LUF34_09180 [Lachnospiraceae bacterium]|nr:hypothetical protein [Lachnospiraceae bacterium]
MIKKEMSFTEKYFLLDDIDKAKAEAYISGILADEKYSVRKRVESRAGNCLRINFGK